MNKIYLAIASTLLFTSIGAQAIDRQTFLVTQQGTSVPIPEATVVKLCGDEDGCTIRLAMINWDGTGRTASRQTLFFYNQYNRNWRTSKGDREGTNNNNMTQHVINEWSCFFTDG